jgi:hypothetical protein
MDVLSLQAFSVVQMRNVFGRLIREPHCHSLQQARGASAHAWLKTKKADLASIAEREVPNTPGNRGRCAGPARETPNVAYCRNAFATFSNIDLIENAPGIVELFRVSTAPIVR